MKKQDSKFTCIHPEGKKSVNISLVKYNIMKDFILQCIKDFGEIRYRDMDELANNVLAGKLHGSVSWYLVTVKLDLEARGIIIRKEGKTGHYITVK